MPDPYRVRGDYRARPEPAYDDDPDDGVVWQPDVYRTAADVAEAVGARRIVDIGCGRGAKLAAQHPRFEILGLDFGTNIAHCRETYEFGTWVEHDLEGPGVLPVEPELLRDSIVVCADVIEHLVSPELLLEKLRAALEHAAAVLVSTPERELWAGIRDSGPPRNRCHVREWSMREFGWLLRSHGMPYHSIGLTRSNDRTEELHTMLAVIGPTADAVDGMLPAIIDASPPSPRRHPMLIRLARTVRIALRG